MTFILNFPSLSLPAPCLSAPPFFPSHSPSSSSSLYFSLPHPSSSHTDAPNPLQLTFRTHAQYILYRFLRTSPQCKKLKQTITDYQFLDSYSLCLFLSKCDQCIMPLWMSVILNKRGVRTEPRAYQQRHQPINPVAFNKHTQPGHHLAHMPPSNPEEEVRSGPFLRSRF